MRAIFFMAMIVLSIGEPFGWSVFVGGPQLAWFSSSLDKGVFISFIVIYDYFILLSCSIWFLYLVLANLILLTFAHAG